MNRFTFVRNVVSMSVAKKAPNTSKAFHSTPNYNREEFGNSGWDSRDNKYSSFAPRGGNGIFEFGFIALLTTGIGAIAISTEEIEAQSDVFDQIDQMFHKHKFDEALKIIDREIAAGRVSGELLHKRVIAFIGKQKLQEALKAANEAIAQFPDHCKSYPTKALVLWQMEKVQDMLHLCEEGLQRDSTNASLYFFVANGLMDLDDYKGAIDAFNKAIDNNKDPAVAFFTDKQILLMKAGAQYVLKQWDDALATIAIVLKMDPKDRIARQAHAETLKAKQLKRNR